VSVFLLLLLSIIPLCECGALDGTKLWFLVVVLRVKWLGILQYGSFSEPGRSFLLKIIILMEFWGSGYSSIVAVGEASKQILRIFALS
jgi:hypothetical protein